LVSCLVLSRLDYCNAVLIGGHSIINYSCRAFEVTLSFMDTLIALTYLLTSHPTVSL